MHVKGVFYVCFIITQGQFFNEFYVEGVCGYVEENSVFIAL